MLNRTKQDKETWHRWTVSWIILQGYTKSLLYVFDCSKTSSQYRQMCNSRVSVWLVRNLVSFRLHYAGSPFSLSSITRVKASSEWKTTVVKQLWWYISIRTIYVSSSTVKCMKDYLRDLTDSDAWKHSQKWKKKSASCSLQRWKQKHKFCKSRWLFGL